MINLLLLIPTLDAGGAERQLLHLLTHLNRQRFKIFLVVLRAGGIFESNVPSDILTLHLKNYKKIFRSLFQVQKFIRDKNINIMHSFLPVSNLYAGLLKLFSGNRFLVVTSQRGLHKKFFNKYTFFNLLAFHLSDIIVTNSKTVKRNCRQIFKVSDKKIRVLYNGIGGEFFQVESNKSLKKTLEIPVNLPVILTLGRFDQLKGHQIVVRAVMRLLEKGIQLHLVLAGDGPLKCYLQNEVIRCGFGDKFHFLGEISHVEDLFSIADIFCLGTYSEGFSNVLAEAMAAGIPVAATAISANHELVTHGVSGMLVKPGDVVGLADIMESILSEKERAKQMSINARKKVQEMLCLSRMVGQYELLYSSLIKDGKK